MGIDGLTAADVAAVTQPNYGAMGGFGMGGFGGDWLAVLVLFALFGGGWGNGGFGGGNGLTQTQLQQGFDTQNVLRNQEGIKNGLCDGFYAQNTTMLQGFNTVGSQIAENRFAAQQCCCETQRQIEGVKYANQQNTCDIINAIHSEGDSTRKMLTDFKIEKMQNKIAELTAIIQSKDLAISQANQNTYLINKLNPTAVPAYVVQNPNCCTNAVSGCGGCNQFA